MKRWYVSWEVLRGRYWNEINITVEATNAHDAFIIACMEVETTIDDEVSEMRNFSIHIYME